VSINPLPTIYLKTRLVVIIPVTNSYSEGQPDLFSALIG
jgi:hypothetical protein